MNFKEYLETLEWKSFSRYPRQNEPIYLNCYSPEKHEHKFLKIHNFNAVSFDWRSIMKDFGLDVHWRFTWLPTYEINEF